MRRYRFLKQKDVYDALDKLRSSFLAAEDGNEVDDIINAILTQDERVKIGRRIIIAQLLKDGQTFDYIRQLLKVGKNTIAHVEKKLSLNSKGFSLINKRGKKIESSYEQKAYRKSGGSKLVYKRKEYTGFTRKDVKR